MNRKLAVLVFVLPFGASFLLAKSGSAAEVAYQLNAPVLVVAQRYDNSQNYDRRDEVRRDEFRRDEFRHADRVWIPGHYERGFLGLVRRWVEGHWEVRR